MYFSSLLILQSDTYHINAPPYIWYRYTCVPEVFLRVYCRASEKYSNDFFQMLLNFCIININLVEMWLEIKTKHKFRVWYVFNKIQSKNKKITDIRFALDWKLYYYKIVIKVEVEFSGEQVNILNILLLKVCHSSAFQTISRKIIDYSDSLSANLNKTIQTKQPAMKKTALLFK